MRLFLNFKRELERRKMWEIFIYLFFGGLTTVVNFIVFFVVKDGLNGSLVVSNTTAWILSVLFAFVTNKLWVFHSKTASLKEAIIELGKFFFYRLLSYFLDMGTMLLLVEVLHTGDFIAKLITQILVVVANYVFSKLFIFKKAQ